MSWMAEGFGSGPEARECLGTRNMGRKRTEASRSSVAQRRRQGDGIERWWDGWGSDEVQPASVGPEMVRSSAVRGQGVLWHMAEMDNAAASACNMMKLMETLEENGMPSGILSGAKWRRNLKYWKVDQETAHLDIVLANAENTNKLINTGLTLGEAKLGVKKPPPQPRC
ncbi:hypothetical protein BKA70DRAFT_1416814 [Coprinopsis sp. MPI-PUGE-AT-0042]|nr:hypothetical protein BKA70DRAFT_1416814 [Coprinopsis sp. MPI-PUGE-AT-0042]